MNVKRIIGVVLVVVGVLGFCFANYIVEQVSNGQWKVDAINQVSSLSSETKGIGEMMTSSGQSDIDKYTKLARGLHIGSVVLFLVGVGVIGFSFVRKK